LYDAVNSGVNAIQCGWNGREFSNILLDAGWKNNISKKWKAHENREKIEKTVVKTIDNIGFAIGNIVGGIANVSFG
ncbi:MAG: hypothetical protein RR678_11450, partial [Lachnospiraceae bacterium]